MKAISLLQPWASLVAAGHKKIETRSWNTKHRGPLLIHASAKKFIPNPVVYGADFLNEFALSGLKYKDFPYGAIIGQVNLIDTICSELVTWTTGLSHSSGQSWRFTEQERAFGDYSPGRWGWLLSDPTIFKTPIPAKGKLGLWEADQWIFYGQAL